MSVLRRKTHRCLNMLLLIFSTLFCYAQPNNNREYELKAVFLFNFTQFVEWPAIAFPENEMPFIIGILGKDPFNNYLNEAIIGEKVNGHPLIVEHYNSANDIKTCHILFINQPETDKTKQIIELLKGRNILTVSDNTNFLKQGGMIRFFTKNNKIQLQINPEAAKNANLIISSKLLRLAEIFVTAQN